MLTPSQWDQCLFKTLERDPVRLMEIVSVRPRGWRRCGLPSSRQIRCRLSTYKQQNQRSSRTQHHGRNRGAKGAADKLQKVSLLLFFCYLQDLQKHPFSYACCKAVSCQGLFVVLTSSFYHFWLKHKVCSKWNLGACLLRWPTLRDRGSCSQLSSSVCWRVGAASPTPTPPNRRARGATRRRRTGTSTRLLSGTTSTSSPGRGQLRGGLILEQVWLQHEPRLLLDNMEKLRL